jgi:hypothetical protein
MIHGHSNAEIPRFLKRTFFLEEWPINIGDISTTLPKSDLSKKSK